MFLEISKDKSFDTLIKRVPLDENTKKLLGTSSRNEIIKSLVENMNSENIAIYRKLISKAEEEDREEQEAREEAEAAFSAQLGGQGSRGEGMSQAGTDTEAYESEESEEVASKFEYSRFKSVRQRYVTLENALPALERLAKEMEIQPSTKSIHTSGYEFFNVDDYDGLIGKNMKKSNTIMDAMEIISESEKGLLDKTEYIKNGILVAISPPLRADRATGKPKRVKKLDDVDVQEIQTRLLEIMNNTYSVEGQEDMTFMDAFKNIHINTFKKTPTAKRDTKSYLSRVQRAFNKISEKEYDEMGSIMKGLQEVLKELEKLGKNDVRLVNKIAELEGYMKSDNLEDMIAYTINNLLSSLKEIKTTYYNEDPITGKKKPVGESVAYRRKKDPITGKIGPEVKEILDQVEEISQNKEKYKDRIIQTIQEKLSESQVKLKEVRRDTKSLISYVPFIEQTIQIIRKFNRITKPDKSELARLKSIVETLEEDDEEDNKELKNAKEQVALEEKSLERYFTLRKRIKQFDAMIGDIKDEFRNLNVLLEPIEEGNEKALQDLVSSISTMFMFTQKEKRAEAQSIVDEIKDESVSEMNPRSRRKKYKKVTSVSMEQLDEMLEAADEAYEVVERLAEKVNEMESLLSEIKG